MPILMTALLLAYTPFIYFDERKKGEGPGRALIWPIFIVVLLVTMNLVMRLVLHL